jgi:acetyl-CoA carboxylase biotin carboxyl carrier protein
MSEENLDRTDGNGLDEVCRSIARLVSLTSTPPRRLTFTAPGVRVELEWPNTCAASSAVDGARRATAGELRDDTDGEHVIVAPMVGTFYRAPETGAKPFVGDGDLVEEGQQVGILEAMKLMTPVHADRSGRITRFWVVDGQSVEYGTPLVGLEPDKGA